MIFFPVQVQPELFRRVLHLLPSLPWSRGRQSRSDDPGTVRALPIVLSNNRAIGESTVLSRLVNFWLLSGRIFYSYWFCTMFLAFSPFLNFFVSSTELSLLFFFRGWFGNVILMCSSALCARTGIMGGTWVWRTGHRKTGAQDSSVIRGRGWSHWYSLKEMR